MAKTPEGIVKDLVKERLVAKGLIPAAKADQVTDQHTGWFHMPVSNGMGVHGIPDFIGHYKGLFFTIETKTPKKDPTPLQRLQINAIEATGGENFVVRCADDLEQIEDWMQEVEDDLERIEECKWDRGEI